MSYVRALTICLLLVGFASAAECHCFDYVGWLKVFVDKLRTFDVCNIIQCLSVFALADRFGVHLRRALGSKTKYFIPPENLGSLFSMLVYRRSAMLLFLALD